MKALSLRNRLFIWASVATTATLALIILLVDVTFRANIREEIEEALLFAGRVAEGTLVAQIDRHIHETATAALDTRLRAAVTTGDATTLAQTLSEVIPSESSRWAAVLDPAGSILAASPEAPRDRLAGAGELLAEARVFDTGDLWSVGGQLVEVGASAILFGASPLAVLVTGRPLGSPEISALEGSVGRPVVLVTAGDIVLGEEASRRLGHQPSTAERLLSAGGGGASGAQTLEFGDERFIAISTPLVSRAGESRADALLLASLDEALQPSNLLRLRLIGIFLLGLAVTFVMSGVFSRAITVPVDRLLAETDRLGRGDLERPIEPLRDDEIGRLAGSFDEMRLSLRSARSDLIRAERLSAIGKAASAVAHDFAQPLSTIAGAVGLLRVEESEPLRERCFTHIEEALDRLQRMKQEVVEFARGESRIDEANIRIDSFIENTVSRSAASWMHRASSSSSTTATEGSGRSTATGWRAYRQPGSQRSRRPGR